MTICDDLNNLVPQYYVTCQTVERKTPGKVTWETTANLAKVLYRRHQYLPERPSSVMSSILQLSCLGRPFHLGMLYDSRSEKLIPGITLWDAKQLKSTVRTRPQKSSSFEIIAEDSIQRKSSSLGIDGSLKLSVLGGLVNVSGSAKYIDDRKSSKQQARVTLKYTSTSRFEELSMEQIKGIQYRDVLEDDDATHVVTGVLYGSDAFFVFDRTISSGEKKCDVHGNMEAMVEAMVESIAGISGSVSFSAQAMKVQEVEKLSCKFHGDLILESNPTSYAEAIQVYGELPALVMKGESIPKVVYLHPLSKIVGRQEKIIQTISVGLISEIEEIMEYIHDTEIQSKDLKKTNENLNFGDIDGQISLFLSLLKKFKMGFVKKLSVLLPKIRGKSAEEKELADLISSIHKSPFNSKELISYVKRKGRELRQLNQYLENMSSSPKIQRIFSNGNCDISSLTANYQYEHVICFAFNVTSEETAFTRKLASYLTTGETVPYHEREWFDDQKILRNLRNKSKRFQDFVEANAKNEDLAFVVTDKNEEIDCSGPAIVLYSNGEPMDFDPPSQPRMPQLRNIREDSIDLVWSAPDEGATSVLSYNVLYGPRGASMSWSKKCTIGKEENIHIERLTPDMEYSFKIEAVSAPGASMASPLCTVKTCLPSVVRPAFDLVKESSLIKESSPSIYQLPLKCTMDDTENKLFKFEIGSPNLSSLKPERVLMMVGATGAGKSTLINAVANFVMGVEWEDPFRFQVITGEDAHSQAQSQTKHISAYTFHSTNLPYVLTILDTPGFGDTGGIENDKRLAKQIKHFFSKDGVIDQLHGIGFVTIASFARLTPTQRYIFDAILSIFGKDIADNIFLLLTFADSEKPPVLAAVEDAKLPHKDYFKFNNSVIFSRNNSSDADFKHMVWKMGTESLTKFFSSFSVATPRSLKMTRDVLKEREQLEILIPSLQRRVQFGLSQLGEIEEEEKVLQQHEAEINANKDFKYNIMVHKHRKVPLKGVNTTNCRKCSFTCHDNCIYPNDADKSKCSAMRNGSCIACPDRCPWESHSNTPYYFDYYDENEDRTYEDLKMKYETAQTEKSKSQAMIDRNETILQQSQAQLFSMIGDIRSSIQHLDEIALRPNPLSDIEYLDLLIESEKREHKTGWKNRIRQYENLRSNAAVLTKVSKVPLSGKKKWWLWWAQEDDQNKLEVVAVSSQSNPGALKFSDYYYEGKKDNSHQCNLQ